MNKYPNKSLKSIDINVKFTDLVAKVLLNEKKKGHPFKGGPAEIDIVVTLKIISCLSVPAPVQ